MDNACRIVEWEQELNLKEVIWPKQICAAYESPYCIEYLMFVKIIFSFKEKP